MQKSPIELTRRMIPRWRNIASTPVTELVNHRVPGPIDATVVSEIQSRIQEWKDRNTWDAAQELIWAATVFGPSADLSPSLIGISNNETLSETIRSSARKLVNKADIGQLDLSLDIASNKIVIAAKIREYRQQLIHVPNNPIVFAELGRLYSQLGQTDQAEKCLLIACGLAPTARYIVRAATRFFVHTDKLDTAVRILSRGDPNDPWVQASRISVGDLRGGPIRDVKRLRHLLDADIDPRHLSELAGSLATLEFGAGNISRAKKLFKIGAIDPNDNMIAQLHWASRNKMAPFTENLLTHSLTFEARASFAKKNKQWKEALIHCADWLQDEPFSSRPAIEGSYIAAEMLQDPYKSLEFCEAGLTANPNDPILLNNLAYCYIALERFADAESAIEKAASRTKDIGDKIALQATRGMLFFRQGQSERGEHFYNMAMQEAIRNKEFDLAQLAMVHYFSEYARYGNFLSEAEVEQLAKIVKDKRFSEDARIVHDSMLKPLLLNTREFDRSKQITSPLLPHLIDDSG